jgi:hypothetical protein
MRGLNTSTVEISDVQTEESPEMREARRSRLIGELDRLFRKAGNGAETRLLYQALLEFRLDAGV